MSDKLEKLSNKSSTELIVYQIGEVKNLLENMDIKFGSLNNRVIDLEKFQIVIMAEKKSQPGMDYQKIILALIGVMSLIGNVALYLAQKTP